MSAALQSRQAAGQGLSFSVVIPTQPVATPVSPLAGQWGSGSEVPVITITPTGAIGSISTNTVEATGLVSAITFSLTGDATASGNFNAKANFSLAVTNVQAAKWTNARTFSYTGDATGGPTSVDGSANVSTALTLATTGVAAGTYGDSTHVAQVTLDVKGRATAASSVAIAFPADAVLLTPPKQKITPATGFSQTIANGVNRLIIVPSGTLATGTVTMPASPVDDQEVTIASTQIITTLTVNGNAGQTVDGTITTIAANAFATWHWIAADSTWYRVA